MSWYSSASCSLAKGEIGTRIGRGSIPSVDGVGTDDGDPLVIDGDGVDGIKLNPVNAIDVEQARADPAPMISNLRPLRGSAMVEGFGRVTG